MSLPGAVAEFLLALDDGATMRQLKPYIKKMRDEWNIVVARGKTLGEHSSRTGRPQSAEKRDQVRAMLLAGQTATTIRKELKVGGSMVQSVRDEITSGA